MGDVEDQNLSIDDILNLPQEDVIDIFVNYCVQFTNSIRHNAEILDKDPTIDKMSLTQFEGYLPATFFTSQILKQVNAIFNLLDTIKQYQAHNRK